LATNSNGTPQKPASLYKTKLGTMYLGDALDYLRTCAGGSANAIITSPPFGLVRKKTYGNVAADKYLEWFKPFAAEFKRVLAPNGSFVLDIGGAWIPGQPTRSLYHYELVIMLCKEFGFHLAQEFFWWNPARLPTPAEWVTVRRVRVKDAINCIWWLSPTPWPKASNKRILQPYSDAMRSLLKNGYTAKLRPSGHDISTKFSTNNGAAIPPNLISLAHTESNSAYIRYCHDKGIEPHPARFPLEIPEFFIRMTTDPGDLVIDPFAGSCATGEAAERTNRKWVCCELVEDYLRGAVGRFIGRVPAEVQPDLLERATGTDGDYYRAFKPGLVLNGCQNQPLAQDGGAKRNLPKSAGPKAPRKRKAAKSGADAPVG
jgi:DNA modification methylase